jgi:hypothetical protein
MAFPLAKSLDSTKDGKRGEIRQSRCATQWHWFCLLTAQNMGVWGDNFDIVSCVYLNSLLVLEDDA